MFEMFGKLTAVVVVLTATTAVAGVDTARAKFDRGEFQKAIAELLPLAQAGDVDAQYWLGRSYDAIGAPGFAFGWFEKAADHGHDDAQRVLGVYYAEGQVAAPDDLGAACLYRKAAESGNAKAQRYFGLMFAEGIGVARDDKKAAYWLQRAVDGGDSDAERNLAHLYYFGVGLPQDRAKAAELYRSAADQGVSAAKTDLGKLYYGGRGRPRDLAKAMALFREAAAAGDVSGQYYLGRMYARGEGSDRNYAEAYFWFTLAATAAKDQDDPDPDGWRAHEWLTKIAAELDQHQIRSAKERARGWRSQRCAQYVLVPSVIQRDMIEESGSVATGSTGAVTSVIADAMRAFINLSVGEIAALQVLESQRFWAPKGTEIVNPLQAPARLFVVLKGGVMTYRQGTSVRRQAVELLLQGDIGNLESAILLKTDEHMVALIDCVVAYFDADEFHDILYAQPRLAAAIIWRAAVRRSMLVEHLVDIGRRTACQRLGHRLLELLARFRWAGISVGNTLALPLSVSTLAEMLALTPEHTSRTLHRLINDGLIEMSDRRITILDPKRLAEVSGFDPSYLHLTGVPPTVIYAAVWAHLIRAKAAARAPRAPTSRAVFSQRRTTRLKR